MGSADSKLVLIVEDTIDLAGFVKIALEEMGLAAHHAPDPERAIAFLETHHPNLIILDIGLPGMSGWKLLELINERRLHDQIRIVVTTAFQDPANKLVGKLQNVDAYLIKPFQFKELEQVVAGLLGLNRA